MKKKIMIIAILFIFALFLVRSSFSLYRTSFAVKSSSNLATWNVTLEQEGINNSLSLVAGASTANYTLNVKSLSEVDIKYDIVLTNIPSGVSVLLDSNISPTVSGSTATFTNVGTILYNANPNINTHTLTFSATSNTTPVSNQNVTINVIAQQILPS